MLDADVESIVEIIHRALGLNASPALFALFLVSDEDEQCLTREDAPLTLYRQSLGRKPYLRLSLTSVGAERRPSLLRSDIRTAK
jgi:hypothetical protein